MLKARASTVPQRIRALCAGPAIVISILCPAGMVEGTVPPGFDCTKWVDSMVVSGVRFLEQGNVAMARQYLTAAYKCGMSKDSMAYFAAELYLRSGAVDTAITFNFALERGGRFNRQMYLEQRSRIFRALGLERAADSLVALYCKHGRHDISAMVSGSRNSITLGGVAFMPQRYAMTFPDADIDDQGTGGFTWKWTRYSFLKLPKVTAVFDGSTDFPVPTRNSYAESSDTLLRNLSVSLGAGDFPSTPNFNAGYRACIHADGKIDHFARSHVSAALGKTGLLSGEYSVKWIRNQGVDDSRSELTFLQSLKGRRLFPSIGVSVAHHYSRTDFYHNKADTSGIYRPLPVGYTDTLLPQESFRLYRDRECSIRFSADSMEWYFDQYWDRQPGMFMLERLPRHDLNATLRSTIRFRFPFQVDLSLNSLVKGAVYPEKIRWYAVDTQINSFPTGIYTKYSIIYNASDGKYYLDTWRANRYYSGPGQLQELKLHEKRRLDCYIFLSAFIEKKFGPIGALYFVASYLKGFSTLNDNDPVGVLDYLWGLSAGWKKEIMLVKK